MMEESKIINLKVLDFINSNLNWEELLSAPPYNLIIKWKEPFVLLKYNRISSDMSNDIVKECRGIIFKKENDCFKLASMKFRKFFNYGQEQATKLDFSKPVYVSQKVDGSLISLWNDKETGWHISTSGFIDARDAELKSKIDEENTELKANADMFKTYYDLFMYAWVKAGQSIDFDNWEPDFTYMFELVSPYNKVIVPYEETDIYWLGMRNNDTLKEYSFQDISGFDNDELGGLKMPKWFACNNINEVKEKVNLLSDKDVHFEGFVLCDCNYNRIKMKSTRYMNLFAIKGDGIFSNRKTLKIILDEEDDDIISYFPEYKPDFERIRAKLNIYTTEVRKSLEMAKSMLYLDKKEYAAWAVEQIDPSILFKYYQETNKEIDNEWIKKQLMSISIDNLLVRIGVKEDKDE